MDVAQRRRLLRSACQTAVLEDRTGRTMRHALQVLDQGDVEGAIALVADINTFDLRCADACVLLGLMLQYERADERSASRWFDQALTLDPSNSLALWHVAYQAMKVGNHARALAKLSEAAAAEPPDTYARITLAWHQRLLGMAKEAGQTFGGLCGTGQRLLCRTLHRMLTPPPTSRKGRFARHFFGTETTCRRDLRRLCRRSGQFTALVEAVETRDESEAVTAEASSTRSAACAHFVNPALPDQRARYGKRLVRHYTEAFLANILVPEVRTFLRRGGGYAPSRWMKDTPPDMVPVRGGKYRLGGGAEPRTMNLLDFQIDRYPVTYAQWAKFDPTCQYPTQLANCPVTDVDFIQAKLYAHAMGKRLPTEAEWEAAAAGPRGRPYPWGPDADPCRANCKERKTGALTPVTRFPRGVSPFGAMDMVGNVQEYVDEPLPGNPVRPGHRPTKGGGHGFSIQQLVCQWRRTVPLVKKESLIGFRCARDP